MPIVETTEYKGSPVIVIKKTEDDKYPFSFGIKKAQLILDSLQEIRQFVADNNQA